MSIEGTQINKNYTRDPVPFDKGSVLLIQDLHPLLREDAFAIAKECWNYGIPLRVYRTKTTPAEQEFLYEFGRTIPGPFYTTSRSGHSIEEMGFAINVGLVLKTKGTWVLFDEIKHPSNIYYPWWRFIIRSFVSRGWLWCNGKPLPLIDKFQKTFGYLHGELSMLKQLHSDLEYIPLDQERVIKYESVHNRKSKLYKPPIYEESDSKSTFDRS